MNTYIIKKWGERKDAKSEVRLPSFRLQPLVRNISATKKVSSS